MSCHESIRTAHILVITVSLFAPWMIVFLVWFWFVAIVHQVLTANHVTGTALVQSVQALLVKYTGANLLARVRKPCYRLKLLLS